jgi:hypothetical protein
MKGRVVEIAVREDGGGSFPVFPLPVFEITVRVDQFRELRVGQRVDLELVEDDDA